MIVYTNTISILDDILIPYIQYTSLTYVGSVFSAGRDCNKVGEGKRISERCELILLKN